MIIDDYEFTWKLGTVGDISYSINADADTTIIYMSDHMEALRLSAEDAD